MIDSVFRTGKNYYPHVLLEEFKYIIQGKTIPKYITDDIEISSDSDKENSNEENSDEENQFFYIYIKWEINIIKGT